VDRDEVTFLDSTGLGVLIAIHKRMGAQGSGLILVCHSRNCLRVMEITALTQVFVFAASVELGVAGWLAPATQGHC
jgi:anti-sigma B factor antagonist